MCFSQMLGVIFPAEKGFANVCDTGTLSGCAARLGGLQIGKGEMLEGLSVCLATLGFLRPPSACSNALVFLRVSGKGLCVSASLLQAKVRICSRYTVWNKYSISGGKNVPVVCFVLFFNECKCQ